MNFQKFVREIVDTFDLVATEAGVMVTRTTEVATKGRFQFLKKLVLYFGLKKVHRYVFRSWLRLAQQGITPLGLEQGGSPTMPSS
ncbi:MAG: hypothetical protein ACLP8Y_00085 [Thermoplasmata archaeon]